MKYKFEDTQANKWWWGIIVLVGMVVLIVELSKKSGSGTNTTTPGGTVTTAPGGTNTTAPGGTNTTAPGGTVTTAPGSDLYNCAHDVLARLYNVVNDKKIKYLGDSPPDTITLNINAIKTTQKTKLPQEVTFKWAKSPFKSYVAEGIAFFVLTPLSPPGQGFSSILMNFVNVVIRTQNNQNYNETDLNKFSQDLIGDGIELSSDGGSIWRVTLKNTTAPGGTPHPTRGTYTVKPDQSCSTVARQLCPGSNSVDWSKQICNSNNLCVNDKFNQGWANTIYYDCNGQCIIPTKGTYDVQSGDTCLTIPMAVCEPTTDPGRSWYGQLCNSNKLCNSDVTFRTPIPTTIYYNCNENCRLKAASPAGV